MDYGRWVRFQWINPEAAAEDTSAQSPVAGRAVAAGQAEEQEEDKMPWPEKQREAIFLSVQRKKGTAAAKRVMHEAGYGGKDKPSAGQKMKARKYGSKY